MSDDVVAHAQNVNLICLIYHVDDVLFLFFQVLLHCEPMVLKFANSTVNDTKYVHYRLYSLVLIASAVFGCVERKVERE